MPPFEYCSRLHESSVKPSPLEWFNGSARHSPVWFGSARLGSARFVRFDSIPHGTLGATRSAVSCSSGRPHNPPCESPAALRSSRITSVSGALVLLSSPRAWNAVLGSMDGARAGQQPPQDNEERSWTASCQFTLYNGTGCDRCTNCE